MYQFNTVDHPGYKRVYGYTSDTVYDLIKTHNYRPSGRFLPLPVWTTGLFGE
jgi:hypothetical protein